MIVLNLIFSSCECDFWTSVNMMSIFARVARISWVAMEVTDAEADADVDAEVAGIVVDE